MSSARPQDDRIRILIVDDHPVVRDGLAAIINGQPDLSVAGQAEDGDAAVLAYRSLQPDITLMDSQMPRMGGTSAIGAIRSEWPGARIIVLSTYGGDAQVLRALKAGAVGYLLKSMVRSSLLDAIRAVHAGHRYIANEVAAELAAHVGDDALSQRELEVLKLVAMGGTNRAIATQLFVSEDTVKSHVKNIMGKLVANDRTHAVTIALKRGIIDI